MWVDFSHPSTHTDRTFSFFPPPKATLGGAIDQNGSMVLSHFAEDGRHDTLANDLSCTSDVDERFNEEHGSDVPKDIKLQSH